MIDAKDWLLTRRQSYKKVFGKGPASDRVLADLAKFCRAHDTTFHENDRAAAVLEGRREVWLRIQHHLQMTPEELWKLYGKGEK